MSVTQVIRVVLDDPSAVGEARRKATLVAEHLGFTEEEAGEVALVVTEVATNVVRHGKGGELIIQIIKRGGTEGLEIIGIDRGPGMDFASSSRDGFSTGGTRGVGLGAIRRISARVDVHSDARGTVIAAELMPKKKTADSAPVDISGVSIPHPREEVCGDAWAVECFEQRAVICVVDGLGHGVAAAQAAKEAIHAFHQSGGRTATEAIDRLNDALKPTRGAAGAVADLRFAERTLRYCGVGNIAGSILTPQKQVSMVSMNGTLGHGAHRVQEFSYPLPRGALVVMNSDGISTQWSLAKYAGAMVRSPAVVAALVYRDFSRGRDDVTVVAAREADNSGAGAS